MSCSYSVSLAYYFKTFFIFFAASVSLVFCSPIGLVHGAEPTKTEEALVVETPPVVVGSLAQLTPKITELTIKFLDMQNQLSDLSRLAQIKTNIDKLQQIRENIEIRIGTFEEKRGWNRQQLRRVEIDLKKTLLKANNINSQLTKYIDNIDLYRQFWVIENKSSSVWQESLGNSGELLFVKNQLQQLQKIIDDAQKQISQDMLPLLQVQANGAGLVIALHTMEIEIAELYSGKNLESNNATFLLFTSNLLDQLGQISWDQVRGDSISNPSYKFQDLESYKIPLVFVLLLFFLVYLRLRRIRPMLLTSTRWEFLAKSSAALSLLICITVFSILCNDLGALWDSLLEGVGLLCLWKLSFSLIVNKSMRVLINTLIPLLLFHNGFVLVDMPEILVRLYILLISFIIVTEHLVQRFINRHKKIQQNRWVARTSNLLSFLLVIVFVSEIAGKADFAYFLFSALLDSMYAIFALRILYMGLAGLLDAELCNSEIVFLKNNSESLYKMIEPTIMTVAFFALSLSLLVIWQVYPTPHEAIMTLGGVGFMLGPIRISIGLIVGAILVMYLTYMISKMIELLLLTSILPQRNVDHGVQQSVVRLMSYAVFTFGFILVLMVLGFNMTSLTVFGGAIGVGIGFGLQEIFNNFASGLILLFERPIKVGDVIMVGTDTGIVKKLGLRSTIVQTFDHAEIVVPNSNLITNQVVNWTLKKRQVRLKVLVGVAYGSDIDNVMKIITNCALEHPLVLSEPKPTTLFLNHGASSLDFELRAFVPDVNDRMSTISEINQEINSALQYADIEIPFPQSDLHLRTISKEAVDIIQQNTIREGV